MTASRRISTPQNRRQTGRDGAILGGEAHRFKPGRSGNPGGRPKMGSLSRACRELLERVVPGDRQERTYAQAIADRLGELALKGHGPSIRELGDRAEGRVGPSAIAISSVSVLEDAPMGLQEPDPDEVSSKEAQLAAEGPQSREVDP